MKTESEVEMEKDLAYFLWLAQLLSYITQDELLRDNSTHSGLSNPISITNQENAPQYAHRHSDWCNFSIELPSTQVTLVFVKLTKTIYHIIQV